jgi:hypothetical protein
MNPIHLYFPPIGHFEDKLITCIGARDVIIDHASPMTLSFPSLQLLLL